MSGISLQVDNDPLKHVDEDFIAYLAYFVNEPSCLLVRPFFKLSAYKFIEKFYYELMLCLYLEGVFFSTIRKSEK